MRYILIRSHLRRMFVAGVQVLRRLQPLRESVGDLDSVAFTKSLVQSDLSGVVPGLIVPKSGNGVSKLRREMVPPAPVNKAPLVQVLPLTVLQNGFRTVPLSAALLAC